MTSHPNPRHDGRFLKYQQLLLSKVDTKIQKGLEIGAFDLPFVTPDMGIVEYADHLSTSELKEKAAQTPGHSPDFVVAVDHVLSRTSLQSLASDYFLFARELVEQFTQKPLPVWLLAQIIGPFLAYEIIALLVLHYRLARGSTFPTGARFANALIETSLPTVSLWGQ
jgi:hypothetical protein